ncbi:DNA ligase (NAD(+)) [Plasmodiophora brassicae]
MLRRLVVYALRGGVRRARAAPAAGKNDGAVAAATRITELRDWLSRCSRAYYRGETPLATDPEFDAAMGELAELESRFPYMKSPSSPTSQIGTHPLTFLTEPHSQAIVPVRCVGALDDVTLYMRQVPGATWSVEHKLDGMTVALRYDQNGNLVKAISRGDGEYGDDITLAVKRYAKNVPVQVDNKLGAPFEVRCQAVVDAKNTTTSTALRAQIAALLRPVVESAPDASKAIDLVCSDLLRQDEADDSDHSHYDDMRMLESMGFAIDSDLVTCTESENVLTAIAHLQAGRQRYRYECVGAIVKLDSSAERRRRRRAGSECSVAFMFDTARAESVLERIDITVGRFGKVSPIAVVQPVKLGHVTVTRATLFSAKNVVGLGGGEPGDIVDLQQFGDVLPKVLKIVPQSSRTTDPRSLFEVCPCGRKSKLKFDEGALDAWCVDEECPSIRVARLAHAVSKDALDVKGVGVASVTQLVQAGLVRDIPDLFQLRKRDLVLLPGWDRRTATAAVANLVQARTRGDPLGLLNCLGIEGVSREMCRRLLRNFGLSPERVLRADLDELAEARGVGRRVAEAIAKFAQSERGANIIKAFRDLGLFAYTTGDSTTAAPTFPMSGKIVVLSGRFNRFDVDELRDRFRALGARIGDQVTAKTSFLFAGRDDVRFSRKMKDARKHGVRVVREDEMIQLLQLHEGEEYCFAGSSAHIPLGVRAPTSTSPTSATADVEVAPQDVNSGQRV